MIMKKPEIDVIRFECSDIVAASSGAKTLTISGMGNAAVSDNNFKFGDNDYSYGKTGQTTNDVRLALGNYFGDDFSKKLNSGIIFDNGSSTLNLNALYGGQSTTSGFNGTYSYDGTCTYTFTKKS